MQNYRDFPEAQKGIGYKYRLGGGIQNPSNPESGYHEWVLQMARKGYVATFYEYNGTTIPYDFVLLRPMEDVNAEL